MVWVSAAGSVRRRTEGELRRLVQGRLPAGADRASREAEGRGMCFSGEQQLCRRSVAACPPLRLQWGGGLDGLGLGKAASGAQPAERQGGCCCAGRGLAQSVRGLSSCGFRGGAVRPVAVCTRPQQPCSGGVGSCAAAWGGLAGAVLSLLLPLAPAPQPFPFQPPHESPCTC